MMDEVIHVFLGLLLILEVLVIVRDFVPLRINRDELVPLKGREFLPLLIGGLMKTWFM